MNIEEFLNVVEECGRLSIKQKMWLKSNVKIREKYIKSYPNTLNIIANILKNDNINFSLIMTLICAIPTYKSRMRVKFNNRYLSRLDGDFSKNLRSYYYATIRKSKFKNYDYLINYKAKNKYVQALIDDIISNIKQGDANVV